MYLYFRDTTLGPSGLITRLSPASLEQIVTYDEDGNVISSTTTRAVGDPASLASLQECIEEMEQELQTQKEQAYQAGATEFKGQHTCR